MAEQKELRVPFNDLLCVVISCQCGAEVAIDFGKPKAQQAEWQNKLFECPVCREKFHDNLRHGFNDFLSWRERVKESKADVSYRIKRSN